jgi:hypothetical protein
MIYDNKCNHYCPEHRSSAKEIGGRLMYRYGVCLPGGACMGRSIDENTFEFIISAESDYKVRVEKISNE